MRSIETLQLNAVDEEMTLKILYKGKLLSPTDNVVVFPEVPKKPPKLIVISSSQRAVKTLNSKRSDPTIRGFDNERKSTTSGSAAIATGASCWGPEVSQHRDYKFVRLEACTWQSFGHRASDSTPHSFQALALLEKLSADPGVVTVMVERELVVNTLGEMDPIDDRIKQKIEQHGSSCLLGYNTNHGLRIDVRLRVGNLNDGFLPYEQIVTTLIHELSHNWVNDHDLLFWTNYGQMRAEYLHTHCANSSKGVVVNGKSTAQIAGIANITKSLANKETALSTIVLKELERDMDQHGLHPNMIAPAIQQRCQELADQSRLMLSNEQTLGGAKMIIRNGAAGTSAASHGRVSARELALAAAEQRARENKDDNREKNQPNK